jgi:hypothetical protein
MKITTILAAAALTVTLSLPALANHSGENREHHHMMKHSSFEELDLNHDGKVSKDEWSKHVNKMHGQCKKEMSKDRAEDFKSLNH